MISDSKIKSAKSKPDKLADEKGMYLLINPNGAKYFRLKYHFAGKEKTLALGIYPETSLKQARIERDKTKALLVQDIDPLTDTHAVKET